MQIATQVHPHLWSLLSLLLFFSTMTSAQTNPTIDAVEELASIEGEMFTGGAIFNDSLASGAKGLAMWGNSSASRQVSTPGFVQITVRARGDQCNGAPHMTLNVNGKQVLSTNVSAASWTDYSTKIALGAGVHTFTVGFNNDTRVVGSCDRNLRLDKITIFGAKGFVHPGVLLDKTQLDFVKEQLANNREPWKSAYNKLLNSGRSTSTARRVATYRYSSLDYQPAPVTRVECTASLGRSLGYEQIGCSEQVDDALAAYTHALLWYYTDNEAHAMKAIEIMDAWSSTLTEILFDQPRTSDNKIIFENGKLQAAWSAQLWTRSAEIIRHTYNGWSDRDIRAMETSLKTVYLPLVETGWTSGANWFASFAESMINIGIFTNDKALFDKGVAYWEEKIPTIIYMPVDGAIPKPPSIGFNTAAKILSNWRNPKSFIAGLEGETCRDFGHAMMGLGGLMNAAETARIQGVDLYGRQKDRILAAYELQSNYTNQLLTAMQAQGKTAKELTDAGWKPADSWVCDVFRDGGTSAWRGFELVFNHFNGRLGIDMPQTKWAVERLRPLSGPAMHLSWETLTHAGVAETETPRDAALHPFASNSIWNTAIGSGAIFESKTGTRTASFLTAKPVINSEAWSISLRQASLSDPLVTLNAVRNKKTYNVHIPADTVATDGADRHVTVIQPDGVTSYDMFKFFKISSTVSEAQIVVVTNLRASGIAGGSRAANIPALAGLIRSQEIATKNIPHALAIAVPGNVLKIGPVWPATREDGDAATSYSGQVPMGTLFAIPGTADLGGLSLSPEGKALAVALQNYGAYITDRAGTAALYCELSCSDTSTLAGLSAMRADWKKLFPYMRAVTNSSPTSVGGGGTPRVAPATEL